MSTVTPFARRFYVMAKPAGPRCNLACRYCYYIDKHRMYAEGDDMCMSDEMLELFVRRYIEAQNTPEVLFTWHGGEPLLRPLTFYRRALDLQRRYANGRHIDNCLQTNGTLLTDEWCSFFHDNGFLVGLSIDGPRRFHNRMRCGSYDDVMRGMELLEKHGVEWNAMATVNGLNADSPLEFYRFFKSIGCRYIQFTPVVERDVRNGKPTDWSVTPERWGAFLCTIFDDWVRHDVGETFVQIFDATLANWCGEAPGLCSMAPACGHSVAMECNGDVYSCDHFVFPEYKLGNIRTRTFTEMMSDSRQINFGRAKSDALPRQCRECRWRFACHGECPKNRFLTDMYGQPGLNYLCEGYRSYFRHVASAMDFMANELAEGRPPANVMAHIDTLI